MEIIIQGESQSKNYIKTSHIEIWILPVKIEQHNYFVKEIPLCINIIQ